MTSRTIRFALAAVLTAALAGLAPTGAAVAADATTPSGGGKLMLVMDSSGSMAEKASDGNSKISDARKALASLTGTLPSTQPVGLRLFGAEGNEAPGGHCEDSQRVVALGTGNRSQLTAAIDKAKPFGDTPLGYALQQAAADLGSSGQRTIVLVSDGEPNCSPDPCAVAKQLSGDGISLRVDVVGLAVTSAARKKLECIADAGHGHYTDADDAQSLGDALTQSAVRAVTPFRVSGTPVVGTTTPSGAPMLAGGDYTDTLGGTGSGRGVLYYRVRRTQTNSTLHVSADTVDGGVGDQLAVTVTDAAGDECGEGTGATSNGTGDPIISAAATVPDWGGIAPDDPCTKTGDYLVKVSHSVVSGGGRSVSVPVELRVQEEQAVADASSLPYPLTTPAYQDPDLSSTDATPIVGGDSMGAATPITSGTYSGSISVGESQAFTVDVGWGQSLDAAVLPRISAALKEELRGNIGAYLSVRIYAPDRSEADLVGPEVDPSGHSRFDMPIESDDDGEIVYGTIDSVAWRNRAEITTADNSAQAGAYTVVVSLTDFADADAPRLPLPFTMGVAVHGTVTGTPDYITAASTRSTASARPSATGVASAKPRADAADPFVLAEHAIGYGVLGVGVLAVIAGVVIVLVLTRRRAAR